MPKDDKIIQPIDADFEDVVSSVLMDNMSTTNKSNKNKEIGKKINDLSTAPFQPELFHVEKQVEFDGIEMGVLESGIAYLSGRGLAKMCGIDHAPLHRMSANWEEEKLKPRGKIISQLLERHGYSEQSLYLRSELNGQPVNAYTEHVCMAILEYYAFEISEPKEQAINAFRTLARYGLNRFVYDATGYKPEQKILDSWKHFHDRTDMTMDAAPFGYFGVFREIAIMIVPMIRNGVLISDKVVPDISVGRFWSEYWVENKLSEKYGERTRYDHEYPDYYPQSKSNPQPSYAYPNEALGEFRAWLQRHYIINKFPKYLLGQTTKGSIVFDVANKALTAFGVPNLPQPKNKKLT